VEAQSLTAHVLRIPRSIDCPLGFSMSLVPRGQFTMGINSPPTVDEQGAERPRRVTITEPFYLARWPITHGTWRMVAGSWRPAAPGGLSRWLPWNVFRARKTTGSDTSIYLPVEDLTKNDANGFLVQLNSLSAAQMVEEAGYDLEFRLPTESEWEFACRAGSTTRFSFADEPTDLDDYAWHRSNSRGRPQKTAMLAPNCIALHDMLGNVWEWCAENVLRGGSARDSAGEVTCDARKLIPGRSSNELVGLRVAATIVRGRGLAARHLP
jgi:formylglycine-generating enzyme required for sulfatase activity